MEYDVRQNFIFKDHAVRGTLVRLKESYQTIIHQHHYPPIVGNLLGEGLLGVILMSSFLKHRGKLTLQFQGEGDLKLLSARCTQDNHIRGLVRASPELISDKNLLKALHNGLLNLTYEPEQIGQPYQSVVEVTQSSIAKNLEEYFKRSEQLPTQFILFSDTDIAAGLMLQVLPAQNEQDREAFTILAMLAETLTPDELKNCTFATVLKRLFHEYEVEVFPEKSIQFGCDCSLERMQNAILSLGEEEAWDILEEEPYIEITCGFCGRSHLFDEEDVARIFDEAESGHYH
jgi:molecular chaperone Hsp33